MDQDLKLIKKKYGENMAKLCREFFPTILEEDGLLSKLLINHFEPNHSLYQDLIKQGNEIGFKNYIYSLVNVENKIEVNSQKSPKELLSEAGYNLYECKTEDEIQQFKKYYARGEQLCTFNGGRLNRCRVFFAIKKDVDEIKRIDYPNPQRQDKYGTSVISIQFTKDPSHTLSIKNRYNHTVNNPDSTFSNNLDNIIEGLTESFEREYGLIQQHKNNGFEIKGYVISNDGKFYKYNKEIHNVYYCPNNIIIDNYEVKRYEKEKYIIMDYFIIDLVNRKISLYDKEISDTFLDTIGDIEKLVIERKGKEKIITIKTKNGEDTKLVLNENNEMIKLFNLNVEKIGDKFLYNNGSIQELNLPNLKEVGYSFLRWNRALTKLNLPNLEEVGNDFLYCNRSINELNLPSIQKIGDDFLHWNRSLKRLNLPNLKEVGDDFLYENLPLLEVNLPNLQKVGHEFLDCNISLKKLNLPSLKEVGVGFLHDNIILQELSLPNLQKVRSYFLYNNQTLQSLNLPNLQIASSYFLDRNQSLQYLDLPNLKKIGSYFLSHNVSLKRVNLPNVSIVGKEFLYSHPVINVGNFKDINMGKVKQKSI